ncbi:MAG: hypothetical protein ACRCY4_06680 [Brevinema sp.]
MQRIIYSVVSLLVMGVLLVFMLPVFIFIVLLVLVLGLIGMLTGRASFRIYTPKSQTPPPSSSPRNIGSVIDITEDQGK